MEFESHFYIFDYQLPKMKKNKLNETLNYGCPEMAK